MGKMSLSSITTGVEPRPVRVLIFAPEGVGKTSFGAGAPSPVFMDVEDGSHFCDVARFPVPQTLDDVYSAIKELQTQPHDFKTLVIDTVDELERLVWSHCCTRDGKNSIEDYGYGKGYKEAQNEWKNFRNTLDGLQRATRMNLVLLGHANVRTAKDPQMVDHDQFVLRVHGSSASLLKEWVDAVGFANHESVIVEDKSSERKRLSYTGKRRLYFERTKGFEAKTRFTSLKKPMNFAWEEFYTRFQQAYIDECAPLREEATSLYGKLPEDVVADKGAQIKVAIEKADNPKTLQSIIGRLNELLEGE